MRSLARLSLSHAVAPSAPDLWAVRSVAHLVALRSLVAVLRSLVASWRAGTTAGDTIASLRRGLGELARVEGVTLSDRPEVPDAEARALVDVADAAKLLYPQALAILRAPRGERRLWRDRLDASLTEVESALARLP